MNSNLIASGKNTSIELGTLYVTRQECIRTVVLCLNVGPTSTRFEGVILYTDGDSGYEVGEVYNDLKKSEWDYFTDTLDLRND